MSGLRDLKICNAPQKPTAPEKQKMIKSTPVRRAIRLLAVALRRRLNKPRKVEVPVEIEKIVEIEKEVEKEVLRNHARAMARGGPYRDSQIEMQMEIQMGYGYRCRLRLSDIR